MSRPGQVLDSPERPSPRGELPAIAGGTGIIVMGAAVGALLRYFFQIAIAKNLGPELFGVFVLGFSVFKIAAMAAEFGLPQTILRFIPTFQIDYDQAKIKGIVYSSIRIVVLSGMTFGLLVILTSSPLSVTWFHNADVQKSIIPLAFLLPLAAVTTILTSATQGFKIMKYKVYVTDVVEPAIRIILVLILFTVGLRLEGVLAAYMTATILAVVLAWHYLKKIFPPLANRSIVPVDQTTKLLSFAWPIFLFKFFGVLLLWTDTLFLGYFKTANDVGIYTAVQRTVMVGSVMITSVNTIFSPYISQLFHQNQINRLSGLFKTVAKWTLTTSLPIYVGLIFFARPVLNVFGPEFTSGTTPLIILSLGWLANSCTGSLGVMITMTGRPILNFGSAAGVLLINILLNLILIPRYGVPGAAMATAVSLTLGNLISLAIVRFLLKMHPYRADFLKPLISGFGSTVLLFVLRGYLFRRSSGFVMVMELLIFLLAYIILLVLMRFTEEEKATFSQLKKCLEIK
jgi:O-antigen/teichoic acid export membrane protein